MPEVATIVPPVNARDAGQASRVADSRVTSNTMQPAGLPTPPASRSTSSARKAGPVSLTSPVLGILQVPVVAIVNPEFAILCVYV